MKTLMLSVVLGAAVLQDAASTTATVKIDDV